MPIAPPFSTTLFLYIQTKSKQTMTTKSKTKNENHIYMYVSWPMCKTESSYSSILFVTSKTLWTVLSEWMRVKCGKEYMKKASVMLPTFKINIISTILSVTKCLLGIKFFSLVPSTEGVIILFKSENTSSFHEKHLSEKEKRKRN